MANIIVMPKFGDDTSSGLVGRWLKQEGDTVKIGDALAEIETDKATLEVESHYEGILLKQFAPAGVKALVDSPLCAIGQPGEEPEATRTRSSSSSSKSQSEVALPASSRSTSAAEMPDSPAEGRLRISPAARKLAQAKGIHATTLRGSGPRGRIVRKDVLAAENALPAKPPEPARRTPDSQSAADRLVPNSAMRTTIARRLVEAKTQIPHFYLEIEIDAAPMLALRRQFNADLEREGIKLSINDFILKASAYALRVVPEVNSSWEGDSIKIHGGTHVAFAVTIDDGLITPVIRDTERKSLIEISQEAKSLTLKARERKLSPTEFTGGTFCVSNLGMLGIKRFSAIINPPNSAILAVGSTVQLPVVKDNQIIIGERLTLTLSCDHRVIDGSLGSRFLAALREALERPVLLLYTPMAK